MDNLEKQGLKGKTKLIDQRIVVSSPTLEKIFGKDYKQFYRLERLRFIDNIPTVVVTTYVPFEKIPDLLSYNFSEVSLFDTMKKDYKITIKYAEKTFNAVALNEKDAKVLGHVENTPIHLVKTITYDNNDSPIEYSLSRDRGDISRFKIT